jgi:hypothetical protein
MRGRRNVRETSDADHSADDAVEELGRLPRLRESVREDVDEIAVLAHSEVTAVLAREEVEPFLCVAQRDAGRRGCVRDGEWLTGIGDGLANELGRALSVGHRANITHAG